jgi:hypothetical protein
VVMRVRCDLFPLLTTQRTWYHNMKVTLAVLTVLKSLVHTEVVQQPRADDATLWNLQRVDETRPIREVLCVYMCARE